MMAILINCITLGSYQPCYDTKCESNRCQWLKTFDHAIFLFFFMEMLIKMIAMGVSNAPQAYLADYWNRLDCFIVIAGGLEYVLDVGNVNLTSIRTVRVLRPLRAINRIPSMRILVTLLLDTLPMLGNVLLLCFFVFFIFGIIGVQLWSGLLRQRCYISLPANMTKPSYVPSYYRLPNSDKEYLCSTTKDNGLHRCQDLAPLRSTDLSTLCQNSLPLDWQPPKPTIIIERYGNESWERHKYEDRFIDGELVPFDLVPGDESSPFLVKQMSPLIAQSVFQPARYAPGHLDSLPVMRHKRESEDQHQQQQQRRHLHPPHHRQKTIETSTVSWKLRASSTVAPPPTSLRVSSSPTPNVARIYLRDQLRQQRRRSAMQNASSQVNGSTTHAQHQHHLQQKQHLHHYRRFRQDHLKGAQRIKLAIGGDKFSHKSSSATNGAGRSNAIGTDNSEVPDDDSLDSVVVETNSNSDQFDTISQSELMKSDKSSRKYYIRKKANKGACINWNKFYTECRAGDINPFQGTISFDNVGMAWTTIFLVISLEGWSDIMYLLQDSHSFWVWIYFVLLIVIGSFFMINLCLVVIATQFSATKKREMERMRQERLKFSSSSTLTAASESTNCYTVIVKSIAKCLRRLRIAFVNNLKRRKCNRLHKKRLRERQLHLESCQVTGIHGGESFVASPAFEVGRKGGEISRNTKKQQTASKVRQRQKSSRTSAAAAAAVEGERGGGAVDGNNNELGGDCAQLANSQLSDVNKQHLSHRHHHHHYQHHYRQDVDQAEQLSAAALRRSSWKRSSKSARKRNDQYNATTSQPEEAAFQVVASGDQLIKQQASSRHYGAGKSLSSSKRSIRLDKHLECTGGSCKMSALYTKCGSRKDAPYLSCRHFQEFDIDEVEISFCPKLITQNESFQQLRYTMNTNIKKLVDHRYFQRLILLAILINAISMGIEYHNQPEQLTEAVEISNIVFACLFLIEMILKLIAHGLYDYVIDGFNCFDGCIVILSILELFESSSGSGLSVLRTFRLLRILKLVRFMPALRRQLVIMLRTLDNVAVFFALLVLFIFIFSILGMNLFGCKFCETLADGTERCDRKNFNSLLWSLVTVFQILTQEDWNVVLFNGMEKTSHWAALYFVLLMTFGNYVLFNLLVAILVEGFSQEDEPKISSASSYTINGKMTKPSSGKLTSVPAGYLGSPPDDNNNNNMKQILSGSSSQFLAGTVCAEQQEYHINATEAAAAATSKSDYDDSTTIALIPGNLLSRNAKPALSYDYQNDNDNNRADEQVNLESSNGSSSSSSSSSNNQCEQQRPSTFLPNSDATSIVALPTDDHLLSQSGSIGGTSDLTLVSTSAPVAHSRRGCKLWSEEKSGVINGDGQLDKDEHYDGWRSDRGAREENQDKLSGLRGAGMCSCARFAASNGSSTIDNNTIAANNNNNSSLACRDPCCRCAACGSIVDGGGSNNFVNVDTQLTGAVAVNSGQHRSRLDSSTTTAAAAAAATTTTTGNLANASSQSIEQLRPLGVDNKQAVNEDLSQMADRCGDDGVNKGRYSVSCSRQASAGKTAAMTATAAAAAVAAVLVSGKQQIRSLEGEAVEAEEEEEEEEARSRVERQQTLARSTSSANFNDGDKLVNLMNTTTTARGHLSACSSQEEDVNGSGTTFRRCSSTSTTAPTAALNKVLCYGRMSNDREQRQQARKLPTSADDSGRKWPTQVSCEDDSISAAAAAAADGVTCKRRINEASTVCDVNQHLEGRKQRQQRQKIWNYGQLVTSIADQSSQALNSNIAELTNAHQQSLAYFGFRRPPKRLVYFYDINDDVDEEIDFLTKSLESKSYATSMLGQHDHYLNNIAKTQAAAAKVKADGKRQSLANQQQQQLYKCERERQIKALGLEMGAAGAMSGSLDQLAAAAAVTSNAATCTSTSTADKLAGASSAFAKRFSQVSQTAKTKDTLSLLSCAQQNSVELVLSPHWCSMPSHLNRAGVAMMRFYQASYANNFYLGKRERALLNERGRFDKSCCRADYDLYAKALNAFIPKHGVPFDSLKSTAAQYQQQQQQQAKQHIDSSDEFTGVVGSKEAEKNSSQLVDASGANVDINLGVIYEPFKLFPLVAGNAMDNSQTATLNGSSSNTTNSTAANTTKKQTSRKPPIGLNNRKLPPTPLDSSGQPDSYAPFETVNRWQRDLLVSLESYANAVARYEARQVMMRKRAQEGAMTMNGGSSNLTRTTSVIRRGSFVVLSKLKMLHGQQQPNQHHHHHQQQQQRPDHSSNRDLTGDQFMNIAAEHSATFQVPRLSLTKADTLNSQHDFNADEIMSRSSRLDLKSSSDAQSASAVCSAASSGRQRVNSSNGLGAICAVSSEESLTTSETGRLADLNTNAEEAVVAVAAAAAAEDSFNCQAKMSYLHYPTGASGYSRHSIANLPLQTLTGTLQEIALPRPSSFTPNVNNNNSNSNSNSNSATNHPLPPKRTRTPSIISWFNHHRLRTNESNNRNSCFSQTSQATSILTEKCTDILKPNLRRRRSFSGPFEWLQREQHKKPYDLMLTPAKKQGTQKKKLKRIKMQKSNSSDYHSLNNRRAYKLDSRGFQTKLKGVFYVITHDPLLANANSTTLQHQQHQHHQQPIAKSQFISATLDSRDLQLSNYDLNQSMLTNNQVDTKADIMSSNGSSFFNTSGDENSLGERTTSRDTNCRSNNSHNQKRTFLRYFRWSQWMIKRRHYSLFIFSPQNRVRRFCLAVTRRKEFDYFVLFFISMNCVTLAMERPKIPPWSKEREFLTVANYYFTFMFTLEMALKVISKGLYYGKDAYLSDSWNIMDGALVGFSLFDLLLSIVADRSPRIFAILRVFRLLRSLRPLRVINRLMGLKLVVQTLLLSLRPIGNIVLICCTFFIIFGILGVQLFKGTFYYCDGPDPLEIMRSVRTKEDCLVDHRNRWVNRKYNFDNLGQALMALFVLSSKDGWVNIMYTGLDAVGVDMQPRENYNEWRLLYFISFLLLVAFFVLNMFVGVVVENFHRCRKEQELEEKARRAEKRQRKLDKRRRKLREPPYYSNYGKFRLLLHKWVTGGYFDLLIAAIIGFNVVFMSLEHYQMPAELIHLLKVTNYGFTAAFILEALIKSTALGMRRYLKDRWNQLDVMIVAMSIIGIIFEEMDSFTLPINPTLLRVLRVMRIARVLKLLKMAKGIRALLDTVMQALPQVGNLGLLFFLLFFIFAALGVELFGRLECNDDYPCSGLMDQHAHFQNFGLAFLTLFRVATGDNWNGIMKDTLRDKCDPSSNCLKNCCISQLIAPLYFVVFVLLAQFVLVNVVVAVLMKHLEESHHEMEIDEEYELDKQLAEELEAKKKALIEARERQNLYWV